ncbi:MAG: hypothetical protein VX294_13055 [Candidatus Latescibacterota bacterium]|nr:hypothetical protein [Candidatus Latescibacterota bacterium]
MKKIDSTFYGWSTPWPEKPPYGHSASRRIIYRIFFNKREMASSLENRWHSGWEAKKLSAFKSLGLLEWTSISYSRSSLQFFEENFVLSRLSGIIICAQCHKPTRLV